MDKCLFWIITVIFVFLCPPVTAILLIFFHPEPLCRSRSNWKPYVVIGGVFLLTVCFWIPGIIAATYLTYLGFINGAMANEGGYSTYYMTSDDYNPDEFIIVK